MDWWQSYDTTDRLRTVHVNRVNTVLKFGVFMSDCTYTLLLKVIEWLTERAVGKQTRAMC